MNLILLFVLSNEYTPEAMLGTVLLTKYAPLSDNPLLYSHRILSAF